MLAHINARDVLFQALLDSAGEGIWGVDLDGNCTFVNRTALLMIGFTAEELIGKNMHDEVHHHHEDGRPYPASDCIIFDAFRYGRGFTNQIDHVFRKDGSFFYAEMSAQPLLVDGAPQGAVVTFRDVTEKRRAEEELRRSREQLQLLNAELEERVASRTRELERANKELEAFSYSVSHDLRAPLRTVDGFSAVLEEDYADILGAEGKDFLKRIRGAANRMGDLIDALLELSRVTRGELHRQDLDLTALAQSVAADLQARHPDRQLRFTIEDGIRVDADPRLLRIVLENLFGNSVKYTGPREVAAIEFGESRWNHARAFFVRDNGVGFDMNYVDRLFGAFQRLHGDREFKGSGIGLATVQRIVTRHEGQIKAEASLDRGAEFTFTLCPMGPPAESST
jgi:PAS domain S-box-containing protein